jgi:hypothetical protein
MEAVCDPFSGVYRFGPRPTRDAKKSERILVISLKSLFPDSQRIMAVPDENFT